MTQQEQLDALVAQALESLGGVDILVNNVGGTRHRPFLEQSRRSWQRLVDLNLVSTFAATAAIAPQMIERGRGGCIINVSSIEGTRAAPNYAVYGACKAAVLNFTRSLALELGEHGIRVNAIAPDYIVTPGLRGNTTGAVDPAKWHVPDAREHALQRRRIPLGRAGQDAECAAAALFLASAQSSYITGATLPVDGGTAASGGWIRDRAGQWTLGAGD